MSNEDKNPGFPFGPIDTNVSGGSLLLLCLGQIDGFQPGLHGYLVTALQLASNDIKVWGGLIISGRR